MRFTSADMLLVSLGGRPKPVTFAYHYYKRTLRQILQVRGNISWSAKEMLALPLCKTKSPLYLILYLDSLLSSATTHSLNVLDSPDKSKGLIDNFLIGF